LFLLPVIRAAPKTVSEKIKSSAVMMPWRDMLFVKFLLLNIMLTICFFLMFRVAPLFYKEVWHIDEFWIGLILGSNGLIIALFEMVIVSRIENKRSPIHYIVRGIFMIALAYCILLLPGIKPIAAAIMAIILFTIGEMLALPFINTFVMSRTTDQNRGQYAAGYTMSWSISQVIGPSAGFYLAEMYGYNWLWIGLILLLIICAWGFKLLGRNMD
jgi:predicted MFS family arabinose efflux permease